jgi:hypothetical protein
VLLLRPRPPFPRPGSWHTNRLVVTSGDPMHLGHKAWRRPALISRGQPCRRPFASGLLKYPGINFATGWTSGPCFWASRPALIQNNMEHGSCLAFHRLLDLAVTSHTLSSNDRFPPLLHT